MEHDLARLCLIVLSFVVLGLAALRFGADSRRDGADRANWW